MFMTPRVGKTPFQGSSLKFSPFTETLVAVGTSQYFGLVGNGQLIVTDLLNSNNSVLQPTRTFMTASGIYDIAWNESNENQIVAVCADGSIKLFDITSPDEFPILNIMPKNTTTSNTSEASSVDWDPISKDCFITAYWNGLISIYNPHHQSSLPIWSTTSNGTPLGSSVFCVAYHPMNGAAVIASGYGGGDNNHAIRLYDARSNTSAATLTYHHAHKHDVLTLDWNKYRPFELISGSADTDVSVWDIRSQKAAVRTMSLGGHSYAVKKLRTSPFNADEFMSVSYDMSVCVWNLRMSSSISTCPIVKRLDYHTEFVTGVDYSLFVEGYVGTCAWDRSYHTYSTLGQVPRNAF